jgi:hypothetical protein
VEIRQARCNIIGRCNLGVGICLVKGNSNRKDGMKETECGRI